LKQKGFSMLLGALVLLINYASGGISTGVIKVLVTLAPPLLALGIRTTLGGLLLFPFCLFFVKKKKIFLLKHAPMYVIKGSFFRVFLPSAIAYWAVQYMGAAKLALFYNFCPFIIYIFSYFMLGEELTRRKLLGIIIGFTGVIPILRTTSVVKELAFQQIFSVSLPEIAVVIAMTSLSYGCIELRRTVTMQPDLSLHAMSAHDSFFGGLLALAFAFITNSSRSIPEPVTFMKWAFLNILLITVIGRPTYSFLLRKYSATLLAIGGLSTPFFTAIFAWFYFGETVSIEFFLATFIILIGCLIFYSEEQRIAKKL